jgi:hypothetical protein
MPENSTGDVSDTFFRFRHELLKGELTRRSRSMKTKVKFMLKKCLSGLFIGLMICSAELQIVRAQSDAETERNRVERIKTSVYRLENTGKTKIVVRLKSGAKLKGYLTKIADDSFDVSNYKTGQNVSVAYRDVARVEKQGLSKAAKYAIGIGVVAAIVVLVIVLPHKGGSGGFCPISCSPL